MHNSFILKTNCENKLTKIKFKKVKSEIYGYFCRNMTQVIASYGRISSLFCLNHNCCPEKEKKTKYLHCIRIHRYMDMSCGYGILSTYVNDDRFGSAQLSFD